MAEALYLKYRPRTFSEVEGQEHVTTTLRNALALGRIAHAYLFTGPRGTGKTTIARVLAKAVNCLSQDKEKPCNTCAVCQAINEERLLDLIEIDAASNTSVEDVRDLRDKVDFRPSEARFKVYIVDEVHMLSNAAFNALLKTLEEPPPHVIFVLATTDPQRIPATVLSRVQRFDFRRLTLPEITTRLGEIASKEGLRIERSAIDLIARQATGSMRDAISLLDQMTAYGTDEITLAQVQGLLGSASQQTVSELVARIAARDTAHGLTTIASVVDNGADPRQLAREIVEYYRGMLLIKTGGVGSLTLTAEAQAAMSELAKRFSVGELLHGIRLFNQAVFDLRTSGHPTLPLEVALVEATAEVAPADSAPANAKPSGPPAHASGPAQTAPANTRVPAPPRPREARPAPPAKNASTANAPQADENSAAASALAPLTVDSVRAGWRDVLARVRMHDKMAEALLRGAEALKVEDDLIVLGFYYQGHVERFEKQANARALIEKALSDSFRIKCRVRCVLSPKKAKLKAVQEDPLIQAAVNQMGAEITEIHDSAAS